MRVAGVNTMERVLVWTEPRFDSGGISVRISETAKSEVWKGQAGDLPRVLEREARDQSAGAG